MTSCAGSREGGALPRRPALIGVLGALLLLGACAHDGRDGAALEPRAELAQKAVLAAVNRDAGGPAGGGKPATTVEAEPGAADASDELVNVEDPRDDQGDAPSYADLTAVRFADSDAALDVSLTLDGMVPGRLRRGEMEEIGVDLFRITPVDVLLGHADSDYQIRLRGGAYGWSAFLRTAEGYLPFPGTFTVSGRTLRVALPWEAVGGRKRLEAEAFVDWSSGVGRLCTDGVSRQQVVPEG